TMHPVRISRAPFTLALQLELLLQDVEPEVDDLLRAAVVLLVRRLCTVLGTLWVVRYGEFAVMPVRHVEASWALRARRHAGELHDAVARVPSPLRVPHGH